MSVIHLKPPRRSAPPRRLLQPLGRFQSPQLPWPRAWAALLLILNGLAHLCRFAWVILATGTLTLPASLVGCFGVAYLLLGVWLRQPGKRALWYATAICGTGLLLGTIGFVTSFGRADGVNWIALALLLLDVLIVPLCAAGLRLPRPERSATPPPAS